MKIFTHTFGCKSNRYETELFQARLESAGAAPAPAGEADLCFVNSCSVTGRADQECRQFVRRLLRENPRARIVVSGCYATRAPAELAALSPRVEVYSNAEKESLPACLGFEVAPEVWGLSRFSERARAFLKIQDGCRAGCRYCVIPRTRPTLWSRPADQVLRELAALASAGHGEIVLTGIRLGLYRGEDGNGACGLASLLERALALPGRYRIRLSSLEVTEVTDDLLRLAASTDRLCPHFHVPLQSADDQVLRDMGRWYDFALFEARLRAVRRVLPEAAVTTDVLAGFPTESEAAFARTLERVRALDFAGLHAFPFSPRPGTPAAALPPLPPAVPKERVRRLREVSRELSARFRSRFLGTVRTAVSEGNGVGWTDNYLRVSVPAGAAEGALVEAFVSGAAPPEPGR